MKTNKNVFLFFFWCFLIFVLTLFIRNISDKFPLITAFESSLYMNLENVNEVFFLFIHLYMTIIHK